jgi:hypothetical protein
VGVTKTLQTIIDYFGIRINLDIGAYIRLFLLIIVDSSRRFFLEAMKSSKSCPAGSNFRPFKSQAGAFHEFPMSLLKPSSSIDKGNGVGSSILFSKPIPGAMS